VELHGEKRVYVPSFTGEAEDLLGKEMAFLQMKMTSQRKSLKKKEAARVIS
jgi:hypothetical protein